MQLKCPNCKKPVSWSEAECRNCGASVTFGAHVRAFLGKFTLIVCPKCGKDVSWRSRSCPACGQAMTIDAAFKRDGSGARLRAMLAGAGDEERKKFQRWFFLVSALLLWILVGVDLSVQHSFKHYILLLTFLPLIGLLLITITPYDMRMALIRRTTPLFKVGFVFNVFSFVLTLKLLIGVFEDRAQVIAVLIGVMVVSAYVLIHMLANLWFALAWLVHHPGFTPMHDPQADQGHKVKMDHE